MHWNGGRFHGPVTLENELFITDHKYNVSSYIESENDKSIQYGDYAINTKVHGKDINITVGNDESTIISLSSADNGSIALGTNGTIDMVGTNGININSNGLIRLSAEKGVVVDNYGTALPTTNLTEGRLFFKLIS
jgi:hypothetical protein